MDGQTNESPLVLYRTLTPLGPLPCFLSLQFTIMQSRATGIADHILPLGELLSSLFLSFLVFFHSQKEVDNLLSLLDDASAHVAAPVHVAAPAHIATPAHVAAPAHVTSPTHVAAPAHQSYRVGIFILLSLINRRSPLSVDQALDHIVAIQDDVAASYAHLERVVDLMNDMHRLNCGVGGCGGSGMMRGGYGESFAAAKMIGHSSSSSTSSSSSMSSSPSSSSSSTSSSSAAAAGAASGTGTVKTWALKRPA